MVNYIIKQGRGRQHYMKQLLARFFTSLIHSTDVYLEPTKCIGQPRWLNGKESAHNVGYAGLIPGLGKILWRRKWQPTPVILPEKFHEERSLVGYSPWGHKRVRHKLVTKAHQMHITALDTKKDKNDILLVL